MSMVLYTPIVECSYGWGQVLRLYRDGLELEGVYYALNELECVYPTYHRLLGISSARLELQFRRHRLIIRGIADVLLAQKIVDYITRGRMVTEAIGMEAVWNGRTVATSKQVPKPESASVLSSVHYFWEYDANDMPTAVEVIPSISAFPRPGFPAHVPSQASARSTQTFVEPQSDVEPWPAMLDSERVQRLKRLQAERELRVYGFDIQALSQRLYNGPLPLVLAPLRLFAGETAHYSIEANLCVEITPPSSSERRQVKDRGKLVLTNRRFIYLGRNRQIILEYEKILQVSCLPGAITLSVEHVPRRQFFETRRPLECSFYLNRLLEDAQSSQYSWKTVSQDALPLARTPIAPPDQRYQQCHSVREHETLKLSLNQLCSTTAIGRESDDTQKLAKTSGKSLR